MKPICGFYLTRRDIAPSLAPGMKIGLLTTDNREHEKRYDVPVPYFGTAPEALLQGFARQPELEVHVLSCTQQPMSSPAKLAPNIWFHSLHVPKLGWLRTGYQGCIRAVRKRLREIRPDLVHGQGTERECAVSAVLSGYPSVVTIHGNMAELARLFQARFGNFFWFAARLEHFTLRRTRGVLCNSEYTEQLVQGRTPRTWRVPNAIREAFFSPAKGAPGPGHPILVNIGVIIPRKQQVLLLDVARRLHEQGLKFELHFIGHADRSDPYVREFFERLQPAEAAGYARYLGLKPQDELIACLDRAAALVHFPFEEAFGLVVAEALARGLQFFGSRVGGIVEIARGPGTEVFALEDSAGLTAAIGSWLRSGAHRPSGVAARMRELYHPEVIARQHVEIYREVLSTAS